MYKIALCDDVAAELSKTKQMLSGYEVKYPDKELMIECFEDAEELCHMVREKGYTPDLILLDIYMHEKTGIEAAKELRNMGNGCRIVFLTTSREHALEAFRVDASQYLVKPLSETVLYPLLDRLLEDIERECRKYVLLRVDGSVLRVAVDDIIYCEAQRKVQKLHLADGSRHLLHMTMTAIYEMLSCYQEFMRVGIAYIVNLEHVDGINAKEIQMAGGVKIYLPRGSYKQLREKYFEYYCERNEE
ncbi:MAG: LytTR family DNA-binding domain-containing protein [Lachnospiraceae bacterium]|nr:LytTR family DNA-binding domain-containing protein [Lachnospiraceae bacterium]